MATIIAIHVLYVVWSSVHISKSCLPSMLKGKAALLDPCRGELLLYTDLYRSTVCMTYQEVYMQYQTRDAGSNSTIL